MMTQLQKSLEFFVYNELLQNGLGDEISEMKGESVQLNIYEGLEKLKNNNSLIMPKLQIQDRHSMGGGENGGEIADEAQTQE